MKKITKYELKLKKAGGWTLAEPDEIVETSEAIALARRVLSDTPSESVWCLAFDSAHRIIGASLVGTGTINRCNCYPRIMAQFLLLCNAAGAMLAHNHPGSRMEFSREDIQLTKRVYQILKDFDIRLLDHIIVGLDGEAATMVERGIDFT